MTSRAQGTVIYISGKVIALIALIIVTSVASVIVLFPLFQSNNNSNNIVNSQVETLELANEHVWCNQTGWFEAAIVVVNTGEKDTILRKITVRSIESAWSDIYYWKTDMGPPSSMLKQTLTELSGSTLDIATDGTQRTFQQTSAELALKSGWTIVLYIRNPGNLTLNDVNLSPKATIAIFSESKLYYKEATIENTQGSQVQQAGVLLVKENVSWPSSASVTVTIRNTGTSNGEIKAVYIGTSSVNMTSVSVASPSLPATINAGASQTLTITYTWSANTRYYFKFATDTPAILEFSEKSP
jgi:hypothetical protein